ncbi:glycerol-3-phosphate dehydrogenase nad-dependent [Lucifera butyrica]|uniref:Glycerol-3-phosphate dehydrogenase [NAD(P)+] n=1 Tax=Lucifera butyrica TaxID=1351585 RepID=A0A498R410_9FIRM|nr:NAD(P)H-dependent glycerol-3-phosphate dehydrogenase [Lucifera butyrica]VBB06161.1 glycerol-3-phosphate dehydrogenase nad-dependent [Lucifera butyrica]
MKIGVIGAGSWGTAIAGMLGRKYPVVLWARNSQLVDVMRQTRQNAAYLPDVLLPQTVRITADLSEAVHKADLVVIATPSHAVRRTAAAIAAATIDKDTIFVNAAKGLELNSLKRMSEVLAEELPVWSDRIAVLSGPNHAEEVGLQYPSTTVVAARSRQVAETVQDIFMLPYFRVYTNPDLIGVELGGALKNIIALCAGAAEGLGFGDNTKAALMTRGLAEITRLGVAMQASPLTFSGLAGIGDLIVTCTSCHSRNRRAGILLAQGKTTQEIETETKMVVEGIRSTLAAYQLAQGLGVEMPITEQAYKVLYQAHSPRDAVLDLMSRGRTHEVEEVVIDPVNWEKK